MNKLILTSLLFLTSCTHYGPVLHEEAKVVQTMFMPSGHGTSVGYNFGGKGGVVISTIEIRASYGVVFQCQHGTFAIEDKTTWERVAKDDDVTIYYSNVLNRKNEVVGLHFIEAYRN